jgi:2'-5' RNA ligase
MESMVSRRGAELKSLAGSALFSHMGDRCFVAVEIDDSAIKMALVRAQRVLEATEADVKCVEEENIHITLKFLGEVPEVKTNQVAELVRGIAFSPFNLDFRGVGVFPNPSRPSVVWAGVSGDVSEMLAVFTELDRGLKSLGFEPERRQFQPHATLCRVRSGRNRVELVEAVRGMEDEEFGVLHVKHITLKRSVLTRSGPIYSTVTESTALE